MIRFMSLLSIVVVCGFVPVPANAVDTTKKLTIDQRQDLQEQIKQHVATAMKAYQAGNLSEAASAFQKTLMVTRQLYPKDEFPAGHADVASCLNNLGFMYNRQGKLAEAEVLVRESLAMKKRLFSGDHTAVALSLNSLGVLLNARGKLAEAERFLRNSLDMRKRLINGDHKDLANSLTNLAYLCADQGKYADGELAIREALDMNKRLYKGDHLTITENLGILADLLVKQGKMSDAGPVFQEALDMTSRLFKGDHPRVANSLNNLGYFYFQGKKYEKAERLQRDALAMRRRLFKSDHPELANSLTNLASTCEKMGERGEADRLFRDGLAMNQRIYPGQDHPAVARSMLNLASSLMYQGEYANAAPILRDALTMARRFATNFAGQKSEGEALSLIASLSAYRDVFLSNSLMLDSRPDAVYAELWSDKGFVARVYEQRLQAARAAATDPKAATLVAELAHARRSRAGLILAPKAKDQLARQKREGDIEKLDKTISELDYNLRQLLPMIERSEKLASANPVDLQQVLPVDAAVVDCLRYNFRELNEVEPGTFVEKSSDRYLAFVVSKKEIEMINLGPAEPIDDAIGIWRRLIVGGKEIPVDVPEMVGELVWAKIRKSLPNGTNIVYISPDMALSSIPWGALPGDEPGTILLEDLAIATIPHAPFLLDKLLPRDPNQEPLVGALVVGGVNYDAVSNAPRLRANEFASRGTPLLKPDQKLEWSFLDGTLTEANGVANAAKLAKFSITQFSGANATNNAILEALPTAKLAHFATHGFFADPSFRAIFQLDEADFESTSRGERIGRAVNSPLVMTGLVLSGANDPETPDRGIITGESLIDLDLSGLELAVLSACETGLGDVAGGEGAFGLQRAFHYAGTENVVASLWKVPDASTTALMSEFYRNLWEERLTPLESLRRAQLEIYHNPSRVANLAKAFRNKFEVVEGSGEKMPVKLATESGKAHPLAWAAFTLSGLGK